MNRLRKRKPKPKLRLYASVLFLLILNQAPGWGDLFATVKHECIALLRTAVPVLLWPYRRSCSSRSQLSQKPPHKFAVALLWFPVDGPWNEDTKEMLQIATDNRMAYVNMHNYTFLNGTRFIERNPGIVRSLRQRKHWLKSTFLLSELERLKDTEIDWIFWLDSDALIVDPLRSLEPLVSSLPPDAAIILANEAGGVNAGSFLVANSPQGRNLMKAWAKGATESDWKSDQKYLRSLFNEEGVLRSNFSTDTMIDSTRYHIVEPCALMAGGGLEWSDREHRPFWEGMFARGDFVVHFWGRTNKLEMMRIAQSGSLGFFS